MSKDGIASIKKELVALYDYLRDIVQGKYKEYNSTNLTLAIGAMIYLVTPLDVVPDFIPTGLIDDVAVVTWAINKIRVELDTYLKWKESNKEISSDWILEHCLRIMFFGGFIPYSTLSQANLRIEVG